MHWGGRMNVIKSEDFFVLINLLARDFPSNNLAKDAVMVIARMLHGLGYYPKTVKNKVLGVAQGLRKAFGRPSLQFRKRPHDA